MVRRTRVGAKPMHRIDGEALLSSKERMKSGIWEIAAICDSIVTLRIHPVDITRNARCA